MFLFDSSLFWYKLVFMGELVAAEALFVYRLKRRRLFALRLLAALLLAFAFAFLLPVVAFNEVWTIFLFLAMWACSVLLLKLCFAESWAKILFCALIAYTAQHIAYDVNNLLGTVTGLTQGVHGLYGEELLGKVNGFSIILYADCYLVIYWLMWLFCGRRIRKGEELSLKHIYLMVLAAVILLIDVVLSIVITYAATEETEQVWLVTCYLYNIISCILAAFLQFGMVNYRHMAQELDIVQGLLYQQKEQYRIAKENIDLINIKCHDLKHQIRSLGGKTVDEGALREIENVVGIYDASVATGNEALDVILTEKSLYCEKNGIRLCCVADGAKLNFMSPADLYALFGNAIENAIESVSRIEDRQKRIINVAVRAAGRLVSIHIDNYFEGEVQIKDGIPVTKKKDTRFHGFGIKSMKYIAEKYDGDFSVSAKEGRFSLNVVIPQRG